MGGFVNSNVGRVLMGVATGGMSEIGRQAAGIVQRSTGNKTLATVAGVAAGGGGIGGASSAVPGASTAGLGGVDKTIAKDIAPNQATGTTGALATTAQLSTMTPALPTPVLPPEELPVVSASKTLTDPWAEYAMRQRASAANDKVKQGVKRASQYLAGVA